MDYEEEHHCGMTSLHRLVLRTMHCVLMENIGHATTLGSLLDSLCDQDILNQVNCEIIMVFSAIMLLCSFYTIQGFLSE